MLQLDAINHSAVKIGGGNKGSWGLTLKARTSSKNILCSMVCCLVAQLCPDSVNLWTVALQVPLSVGFPRHEYRSGLPLPSPGDLPDPGIETVSLAYPALAGRFFTSESPGKTLVDGFQTPDSLAPRFPLCYILNYFTLSKQVF